MDRKDHETSYKMRKSECVPSLKDSRTTKHDDDEFRWTKLSHTKRPHKVCKENVNDQQI